MTARRSRILENPPRLWDTPIRMPSIRTPSVLILLVLLVLPATPATAQPAQDPRLETVQSHLDRGDAGAALELLNQMLKKGRPSAQALLLRSTARIMAGDTVSGFKDLQRALKIDPALRQGWLNLAGLEIVEGRFEAAHKALVKARDLAPDEPDDDLNLGAVMVLRDKLTEAAKHFERYLAANPGSADAYYLVASNYALKGIEAEAVAHLSRAVQLDEHMRLKARGDERFVALRSPGYRRLLMTDVYRPPPGSHRVQAAFDSPYRRKAPKLVYAVLGALKTHGFDYSATVEATDDWALIWSSKMRIKIFTQRNGTGVVQLSAPAERYSKDQWDATTQKLFRTIYENVTEARIDR